jgi:RNA polymerase sigma-70 factor (ECF subfamily)
MVDPDTKLMLDFCSGDASAFRELVKRNSAVVFKLACRYVGDPSDAEDAVQDVFMRVYGAAEDYRPSAKFTTWVYRITVNVCLNRLRSTRSHPVLSLDAMTAETNEPVIDMADTTVLPSSSRLERQELEAKIRVALAGLPESQRTAVLLRRFEEMSYDEIAEVMQTTVPAVKSLLARARQTLKSSLANYL